MTKIILGMSGGIDSSVAAHLLLQDGFEVNGIFMQNWEDDNDDEYCSIKQDASDVIAVADVLGIDVDIVNFAEEYKDRVFNYFLREYQNGRTPNPDILCNSEIKFKSFLEHAISLGADYIATGHYVDKVKIDGYEYLTKATDTNKDQSYFLYRLNQHQITHSLFPLGKIIKPEIRRLGLELNLPNASKKDSTGICFIGERPFRQFLQQYLPTTKGDMINPNGAIVGQHLGLMYYTIGQRKGLGIGGDGDPWFVAAKDLLSNKLIVVQGHEHELLYKKELYAIDLSFANGKIPPNGEYMAKTRYRMQDAKCYLTQINSDKIKLEFAEKQWAITPGQSAVIYDGNICLGGGIIE